MLLKAGVPCRWIDSTSSTTLGVTDRNADATRPTLRVDDADDALRTVVRAYTGLEIGTGRTLRNVLHTDGGPPLGGFQAVPPDAATPALPAVGLAPPLLLRLTLGIRVPNFPAGFQTDCQSGVVLRMGGGNRGQTDQRSARQSNSHTLQHLTP